MRRVNAILSALIILILVIHGIDEGFSLIGEYLVFGDAMRSLARVFITLVAVHAIIGIILTVKSIISIKKSGTFYIRENTRFLASRISGLCIAVFLVFHLMIFIQTDPGNFELKPFDTAYLITQILLAISIAIHVLTNIKPVFISLGAKRFGGAFKTAVFVASIILLFFAASFTIYYLIWNVF